jgi:hypothetical protein
MMAIAIAIDQRRYRIGTAVPVIASLVGIDYEFVPM